MKTSKLRFAADIGGTFTDIVAFNERTGAIELGKTLSTPNQLINGILEGLQKANVSIKDANLFLHGSTVAINTMLERKGAMCALITTRGFRDIYEIGRINRPDSFNLRHRKHQVLIERDLRFEISERMMADGKVYEEINLLELEAIANTIEKKNIQSVAVLFLHSYRNPSHEIVVKNYLQKRFPNIFVSISSEISKEYREFERTSTVVANAYIGPRVHHYLGEIEDVLTQQEFQGKFLVVQSTGGLYSLKEARQDCVKMMESGPAAGVIGTQAMCEILDIPNAIAFDMGGTTAKAGVVRNYHALVTNSVMIGGYFTGLPLLTPMIDIHEVGTGGGSIALVNEAGALRVGPQSAGASPGPVCYNLGGTTPTVTDANLALGRLDDKNFLGGEMLLNKKNTLAAIKRNIAKPLQLTVTNAAMGILKIAAASMSHAVKGVTTDRGLDPSSFPTLFAYGGAGPLHASMVARELRLPRVIIPRAPGHFSAFGMLLSDFRRDLVKSQFTPLESLDMDELELWYQELEKEGLESLHQANIHPRKVVIERSLDMRYVGQEHAVTVDVLLKVFEKKDKNALKASFDLVHKERYGRGSPHEKAEIVSIRTTIRGIIKKPVLETIAKGTKTPPKIASRQERKVFFSEDGWLMTKVFDRSKLLAGNQIKGPALIEEHASTTIVQPNDSLLVDQYGNLDIAIAYPKS